MAKPLYSSPETITTLLIDYTPIQNKKLKKKRCNEIKVSQTGAKKQTKQERVVDWGRRKTKQNYNLKVNDDVLFCRFAEDLSSGCNVS